MDFQNARRKSCREGSKNRKKIGKEQGENEGGLLRIPGGGKNCLRENLEKKWKDM